MASTPRPPTPPTAQIRQYSWRRYINKEVCLYIRTLEPLKAGKKEREAEFKPLGSTNYDDIMSDVIVTEVDGDVTRRDVNKPIARERYAQKHSFVSKKGFIKSSLKIYSQTFTKIAFILAIVISILGGLCNIKLPERKSPIGTSPSLSSSEPRVVLCFLDSSVLSSLRKTVATVIGISEGICSCLHKGMFLNNDKQLIRCMKVLLNTIICEKTLASPYPDYATCALATFAKKTFWRENVWLHIYSCSRTSGLPEYII